MLFGLTFLVSFDQHVFFSFIIKLLYCQKSQNFKFVHLKNNLYHQKAYKNNIQDIIMVTLVFDLDFEL